MITEVVSFFFNPATPIPSSQGAPDKEAESEKNKHPSEMHKCCSFWPSIGLRGAAAGVT